MTSSFPKKRKLDDGLGLILLSDDELRGVVQRHQDRVLAPGMLEEVSRVRTILGKNHSPEDVMRVAADEDGFFDVSFLKTTYDREAMTKSVKSQLIGMQESSVTDSILANMYNDTVRWMRDTLWILRSCPDMETHNRYWYLMLYKLDLIVAQSRYWINHKDFDGGVEFQSAVRELRDRGCSMGESACTLRDPSDLWEEVEDDEEDQENLWEDGQYPDEDDPLLWRLEE